MAETETEAPAEQKAADAGGGDGSEYTSADQLSGAERAAVLIMSMGVDAAGQIFRNLDDEEIERLTVLISKVDNLSQDIRIQVLKDFVKLLRTGDLTKLGSNVAARALLDKALGSDRVNAILGNVAVTADGEQAFGFLEAVDAKQISMILRSEQPQIIALVLSHMKGERAAQILRTFPDDVQPNILARIGKMNKIAPSVIRRVEQSLAKQLNEGSRGTLRQAGGVKQVADILNATDREMEKHIIEYIQADNNELADEIKNMMLTIEDFKRLTDQNMQALLREVDMGIMALALKGTSDELRNLIYKNLSSRAAERLKEELELMGPKPRKEVKDAQTQIVAIARELDENGTIQLSRGGGGRR